MPLFLITGNSGTGKSQLSKELKSRGYETYDIDDDGLAKWQNNLTGYIHPKSSVKIKDRTEEFLGIHSWNVARSEIEELTVQARAQDIFVCGLATNEQEIRDLFKVIFALDVDDETLKQRLLTRDNNDWGKQPHELKQSLDWQHEARELYKKNGYILIDAAQPVKSVVDNILSKV